MIDPYVYRSIRNSICAIVTSPYRLWGRDDDDAENDFTALEIKGTGFLIGGNQVLTNRHIAESIHKIPNDFIAVIFWTPDSTGNLKESRVRIGGTLIPSSKPTYNPAEEYLADEDLVVFEVDLTNYKLNEIHKPVKIGNRSDIQIGEDIGVCGYIHGNELLGGIEDTSTLRVEPLLLQGHIAGLSPHDNLSIHPINLIITDITNGGGLSGSPVFKHNGTVIGIHRSGLTRKVLGAETEGQIYLKVPQGLGISIPLVKSKIDFLGKMASNVFSRYSSFEGVSEK